MIDPALWIAIFVVLALNLLFASTRAAMTHVRLPQLIELREQRPAAVERCLRLLEKPSLRVALRFSVVVTHFLLGGLILAILSPWVMAQGMLGWLFLILVVAALIGLMLEFLVERLVLSRLEHSALALTSVAVFLNFLLRPFTWLLLLVVGPAADVQRQLNAVTEDELKSWVEDVDGESSLEKGERKMIYDIFQFSDRLCREIMVPRIDMVAMDVSASLPEAIQMVTRYGHSRIPVYEETIDNILGLLYAKDLLRSLGSEKPLGVRELLRPAYFIPEAKKVDELLREMQAQRIHMALVVDEYGGLAGMVTLEDIVEEIVGEIRDEFDQSEELLYQIGGPDEVVFHGRIDLDDFNEVLGTHLVKDVADSLGGYIYGQIGRVPLGGEQMQVEDWTLTVEQVSGQRIRKVRAQRMGELPPVEEKIDDVD